MHKVLVFGAGRSSGALIDYLIQQKSVPLTVSVVDQSLQLAQEKTVNSPACQAIQLNIFDDEARMELIKSHDIVVSLMPPHLHHLLAKDAILFKKHIITASYISEKIAGLHDQAVKQGVMIMGELGLDPGLDHMSALKEIDALRSSAKIIGFKSATGGVVAPESMDNPWGYKITWNPRNVVLAGKSGASFLENGVTKKFTYDQVFKNIEIWDFPALGQFEVYPNRDSLKYLNLYQLDDVQSIYRGTIRYPGFCGAWDLLLKLGLTNDKDSVQGFGSIREWTTQKHPGTKDLLGLLDHIQAITNQFLIEKLQYLELFSDQPLPEKANSSADVLQHILENKWSMQPKDKDMILMQHQFFYEVDDKQLKKESSLSYKGHDAQDTAMSRLVGLPMGILALKILQGLKVPSGVHIPNHPDIYLPVLQELESYGVEFTSRTSNI